MDNNEELTPEQKRENLITSAEENSRRVKSPKANKVMVFDSETGQLVVQSLERARSEDNIVVDQIYKDGFFARAAA